MHPFSTPWKHQEALQFMSELFLENVILNGE